LCVSIDDRKALLEAADIDALIEHLAMLRAHMRPEIPKVPARTHDYVIEIDPCWHAEKHPLFEGAIVFFRHTGLGWAGFAIPTSSLLKLNEILAQHAQVAQQEVCALPN
jgi:hypothetical protein